VPPKSSHESAFAPIDILPHARALGRENFRDSIQKINSDQFNAQRVRCANPIGRFDPSAFGGYGCNINRAEDWGLTVGT